MEEFESTNSANSKAIDVAATNLDTFIENDIKEYFNSVPTGRGQLELHNHLQQGESLLVQLEALKKKLIYEHQKAVDDDMEPIPVQHELLEDSLRKEAECQEDLIRSTKMLKKKLEESSGFMAIKGERECNYLFNSLDDSFLDMSIDGENKLVVQNGNTLRSNTDVFKEESQPSRASGVKARLPLHNSGQNPIIQSGPTSSNLPGATSAREFGRTSLQPRVSMHGTTSQSNPIGRTRSVSQLQPYPLRSRLQSTRDTPTTRTITDAVITALTNQGNRIGGVENAMEKLAEILSSQHRANTGPTRRSNYPKLKDVPLPSFSGERGYEFKAFWEEFNTLVGQRDDIEDNIKLVYLRSCLKYPARCVVEHLPIESDNYKFAITQLRKRYGSPSLMAESSFKRLQELSKQPCELNVAVLSKVYHEQMSIIHILEKSANTGMMANVVVIKQAYPWDNFMKEIVAKENDFNQIRHRTWNVSELMRAIESRILLIDNEERQRPVQQPELLNINHYREQHQNREAGPTNSGRREPHFVPRTYLRRCVACQQDTHTLVKCPEYPKYQDKKRAVNNLGLCKGYLRVGNHPECEEYFCKVCKRRGHNAALCETRYDSDGIFIPKSGSYPGFRRANRQFRGG